MSDFLLIHIDNHFDITQVISYDKATNMVRQLTSEQLKSSTTSKSEIILLVPASWVYLTHTRIASRSADVLQKSIPYSIEDELINDIEDNYYAWQVQAEQQQRVAVISKIKRHQINEFLKKQQLRVSGIYSEAVFCPAKEQQLSYWQDKNGVIIRFGLDTAMMSSAQQLPQLITTFGQDCRYLLSNNPDAIETSQFESVNTLTLADCCSHLFDGNEVNLYRGDDQDNEETPQLNNWLKPLVAFVLLIFSWLFVNGYQGWKLSSDIDELKSQQQQILKNKFGNISTTEQRDPFAALQSRLKQANSQNQPNSILIDGVYFLGEARHQQQNIEIKSIRLFDNVLEIQVTAPAISDINAYRQQLHNLALDYRVNIGVNELTNGVYQSILTLKPR